MLDRPVRQRRRGRAARSTRRDGRSCRRGTVGSVSGSPNAAEGRLGQRPRRQLCRDPESSGRPSRGSVSTRIARRTASRPGRPRAAGRAARRRPSALRVAAESAPSTSRDGVLAPRRSVLEQQPATAHGRRCRPSARRARSASAEQRIGASSVTRPGPGSRAGSSPARRGPGRKERLAPIADTHSAGYEPEHRAEDAADQARRSGSCPRR